MINLESINNNTSVNSNTSVANTTSSSSDFSTYLNNATTSLDSIFQKAADTYGVDVNLLKAIGKAESDFDTNAVSSCGAQGIMQLMPKTAQSLGVTDSFDAEQNIMGGAKYIKGLLDQYNGDTTLALAAYNAGSGNVAKYGGVPPFTETQNYVVKVTQYMNEGVTVPNSTYQTTNYSVNNSLTGNFTTGETSTVANKETSSLSNSLFTYEDYLRFLEIYQEILFGNDSEEEANEEANKMNNTTELQYTNINFNNSILNII